MKILTFVDVHGNTHRIRKLVEKAKKENVELLLCAGDLTNFGVGFFRLLKMLDIGLPLIIIPGNHESPEHIARAEKKFPFVKSIHTKSFSYKEHLFFGCGGSSFTPFHTPYELDKSKFEKMLKLHNNLKNFIFVTHEPPFNTSLDFLKGPGHIGNIIFRKFAEKYKPIYYICGHFHENAGKQDKIKDIIVINPGDRGKIIEI